MHRGAPGRAAASRSSPSAAPSASRSPGATEMLSSTGREALAEPGRDHAFQRIDLGLAQFDTAALGVLYRLAGRLFGGLGHAGCAGPHSSAASRRGIQPLLGQPSRHRRLPPALRRRRSADRVRGSWPRLRRAACAGAGAVSSTLARRRRISALRSASRPALRAVASLRAALAAATACWAEATSLRRPISASTLRGPAGFRAKRPRPAAGPGPPRPRSPAVARAPDPGRYGRGGAGCPRPVAPGAAPRLLRADAACRSAARPVAPAAAAAASRSGGRRGLTLVPRRPRRFGTWPASSATSALRPRPASAAAWLQPWPSGRANGDRARAPAASRICSDRRR